MPYFQHIDLYTGEPITLETPVGHIVIPSTVATYNSLRKTTKTVEVVNYEMILGKLEEAIGSYEAYQNFAQYALKVFSMGNQTALHSYQRLLSLCNSKESSLKPPGNFPLCKSYRLLLIETSEQFTEFLKVYQKASVVYCDTETEGLRAYQGSIQFMQLGVIKGNCLYIFLVPAKEINFELFSEWVQGKSLVFHNLKFDMHQLVAQGVDLLSPKVKLNDTMLMYRCFFPGILIGASGLNDIISGQYPVELDKKYQKLSFKRNSYCYDMVDYAACDIYALHIIHSNFVNFYKSIPHLESVVESFDFFYALEMETLKNVFKMEFRGVSIDFSKLEILFDTLSDLLQKSRADLEMFMGVGGNPNSPLQVMSAMEKLSKGKVVIDSTQAACLEKLLSLQTCPELLKEFIKVFLDYKKNSKLQSFVTTLPLEISPDTKKIHASFNHSGTSTGRFSCNSPNLQQIPRDGRMRELFVASPGCSLVVADYGQIELVIAAQITQDETLMSAYREGIDVHKLTASKILNKPIEEISKNDRQLAKAVNFGLIYGMGAKKLVGYAETSYNVSLSLEEAERFRYIYLNELYPGIKQWHKVASEELGFYICPPAVTLLGRNRLFRHPILGSSQGGSTFSAYINSQDQGTGADIVKLALMLLDKSLNTSKAYPVLQVHDEIVVEAVDSYVETAKVILEDCMIKAAKIMITDIPVTVEVGSGKSWGEAK